ncbi:MAG: sulfite exporter TauE/SafE family protein [Anaerolineae bacterium]
MTDPSNLTNLLLVALAAMAAGAVNAIAGGGTLISFPALMAVGLPAVSANVTNTVALVPGYLGATFAQAKDLQGQERRLHLLVPTAILGGLAGGLLLLGTSERLFRNLVPWLILLACVLLASQEQVRGWVLRRASQGSTQPGHGERAWVALPVFAAAIYGGYFGAGLSVIVLAVLALVYNDTLTRLNGLKQAIAFSVNMAAAVFFLFSGRVVWQAALVMAVGASIGGALGGRFASRIPPVTLRRTVVGIGVVVALIYLVR